MPLPFLTQFLKMIPAIVRLSKKLRLNVHSQHDGLKELWTWTYEKIEEWRSRSPNKDFTWISLPPRYQKELSEQINEWGTGVLHHHLKNRFPTDVKTKPVERSFLIEQSNVQIDDFTADTTSLTIDFYFITEKLLALENIGNQLLLANTDQLENFKANSAVNTFCISLSADYDIAEYSLLNKILNTA